MRGVKIPVKINGRVTDSRNSFSEMSKIHLPKNWSFQRCNNVSPSLEKLFNRVKLGDRAAGGPGRNIHDIVDDIPDDGGFQPDPDQTEETFDEDEAESILVKRNFARRCFLDDPILFVETDEENRASTKNVTMPAYSIVSSDHRSDYVDNSSPENMWNHFYRAYKPMTLSTYGRLHSSKALDARPEVKFMFDTHEYIFQTQKSIIPKQPILENSEAGDDENSDLDNNETYYHKLSVDDKATWDNTKFESIDIRESFTHESRRLPEDEDADGLFAQMNKDYYSHNVLQDRQKRRRTDVGTTADSSSSHAFDSLFPKWEEVVKNSENFILCTQTICTNLGKPFSIFSIEYRVPDLDIGAKIGNEIYTYGKKIEFYSLTGKPFKGFETEELSKLTLDNCIDAKQNTGSLNYRGLRWMKINSKHLERLKDDKKFIEKKKSDVKDAIRQSSVAQFPTFWTPVVTTNNETTDNNLLEKLRFIDDNGTFLHELFDKREKIFSSQNLDNGAQQMYREFNKIEDFNNYVYDNREEFLEVYVAFLTNTIFDHVLEMFDRVLLQDGDDSEDTSEGEVDKHAITVYMYSYIMAYIVTEFYKEYEQFEIPVFTYLHEWTNPSNE
jgi:hypothetical protein